MQCLRFLGILLASADEDGHVHTDPDDLAGLGLLHGMTTDEVNRSRILLETFGVLDRESTGWFIKHFTPVGDEVPPADAMAAIDRVLAKPAEGAAPATVAAAEPEPAPAGAAEPAPVVAMEPARNRLARRWMAAPVGAAAAAAVVLVALMFSGQVRTPLNSSPASNANQSAVGAGATATTSAPGQSPTNAATAPSPSPSAGSATAPSVAQTPTGTAVPGTQAPAQVPCPVGNVSATVDHMSQHLDNSVPSSISIDLGPIVHTTVTGSVHNNSPSTVDVNPFPVTVNFADPSGQNAQTVSATALARPTLIGAGGEVPWSVTVQNPKDAPVPGTANAAQPTWHWDDAQLAATCTH